MASSAYINVDGETCLEATLHVPNVGPWWAEVVFELAPEIVAGPVVLTIGELTLRGSVDPTHNGVFGEQRRSRIVAGAGGWSTLVTPQHYHSDSGVSALSIAQDAARLAGETLGTFSPGVAQVGIDYVRKSGSAASVLEDIAGGVPWYVDYDGITNVAPRAENFPDPLSYQVLENSPSDQLVTLALSDLARVGVGSTLTEGLESPLTVRELELVASPDMVRARAWGGGLVSGRGRLAGLLASIVGAVGEGKLFGKYRYRVLQMATDRVELQRVAIATGLPDVLPISAMPGVAGAHAKLTPGSIVLVEFIEGSKTLPVVTAFAGKDGEQHDPQELDFSVVTKLRLGSETATVPIALAPSIDSQLDDINAALDAFAVAVPATNDGGAVIHSALKAAWGTGSPPKPPSDVGASKVVSE